MNNDTILNDKLVNPVGLEGVEFVEYSSANSQYLDKLFKEFGFSKTRKHSIMNIDYYNQNDIHFLVNNTQKSYAQLFSKHHGPSICSMGWRVRNAKEALRVAKERGAVVCERSDLKLSNGEFVPAVYGIGESLIYFIDNWSNANSLYSELGFEKLVNPEISEEKGFLAIDHLTNNVAKGTMDKWSHFYKEIFGFTEVRYFDIRGAKTGLISYALRSPCGKFCIPINEGTEDKSQINEYLREYNGPGIQHLAFSTADILASLRKLKNSSIETLDIDDEYYSEIFKKFPNITESHQEIRDLQVLVDGDDHGYLLQIFTKNIIGPIFIEIIQRKNNNSFGEGNFGALFRSIERDQQKRGVL